MAERVPSQSRTDPEADRGGADKRHITPVALSMSALTGSRQRTTKVHLAEIGLCRVESGYPSCQPNGELRIPRVRPIRTKSALQLTVRESRSQGFDASLDAPEGSMLPKTWLPGV